MSSRRGDALGLHATLVADLGDALENEPVVNSEKPLTLRCRHPLPRLLRVYLWLATNPPGERAVGDFKTQLTLAGIKRGTRGHFDFGDGAWVLLIGLAPDLGVYVLWDAGCHDGFAWSSNVQVHAETVYRSIVDGVATQTRRLRHGGGHVETVITARRDQLKEAIVLRVSSTTQRLIDESQ
jgi:hypothetical protein